MQIVPFPQRIETQRLLLQRLRLEDAEEIFYSYASKPEATKYVSWPTHQTIEDTRTFLYVSDHGWKQGTGYNYSIRLRGTNVLVGSIGAIHESGNLQFGYILGPAHWSNGYATEACGAFITVLRNIESIYRIWTLVDTENRSSVRVLQKCGLTLEATLPKWMRFVNQDNTPRDCFLYRLVP